MLFLIHLRLFIAATCSSCRCATKMTAVAIIKTPKEWALYKLTIVNNFYCPFRAAAGQYVDRKSATPRHYYNGAIIMVSLLRERCKQIDDLGREY